MPPLSELVEPAHESEPVSLLSFMEPQSVAPVPEVSAPEPSLSAVIPEAPPAPEPVSTEHHEIPIPLSPAAEAPPLSVAPSDASSASPAAMDTTSHWSTGEVEVQPHRPSEKKRNWDKEKGEVPVVPPAPLPLVEESSEAVAELSRSGGWESVPSEADPEVEAVAPIVEKVVPQEDTRPEWVRASESITFVRYSLRRLPRRGRIPASNPITRSQSLHSRSLRRPLMFFLTQQERKARSHTRIDRHRQDRALGLPSRVARVRIGISSFIGSCFSTTRSIVLLCVGLALLLRCAGGGRYRGGRIGLDGDGSSSVVGLSQPDNESSTGTHGFKKKRVFLAARLRCFSGAGSAPSGLRA